MGKTVMSFPLSTTCRQRHNEGGARAAVLDLQEGAVRKFMDQNNFAREPVGSQV